ncbi:MAG: TonB C-terminal domain-containing protein [Deltaproteobacteria bacterium]|uniref:TonB C-terminal domain-containing protein n=1 Tax=Candidatus Desulfacyla euxinica TaxID=2841693 RepID=A0A8J6T5B6_9DELT|nr:TonB C-terminal domain-containing protein [Candidatus Desulfacyla euxinica]
MEGLQVRTSHDELEEPRWSRVIILSLLFHIIIFSVILFVPDSIPTRRISGAAVYEVNLVEMPGKSRSIPTKSSNSKMSRKVTSSKTSTTAKRISRPTKEEKPVVIGKRVVKRKKEKKKEVKKPKKPRVSPSRLIDRAVSKIEKRVKAKKNDHLAQAISKIQTRAEGTAEKGSVRGNAETGITIRMYQMAVEEQIKNNWSYPVALISPEKLRELEAIVVVKVKEDGTIMKSWFKGRSSNSIFDGSVLKAIEKSDPLPPFPEGYRKSYDEIEIRFDLSELEDF